MMTPILEAVRRRRVRSVMASAGKAADDLLWLCAGTKKHWTLSEWNALAVELNICEDTVEQWLEKRNWLG